MNKIIFVMAVLFACISQADVQNVQVRVPELSEFNIVSIPPGCGPPPPPNFPPPLCPAELDLQFTVRWGGGCHHYFPQEIQTPQGFELTILDRYIPCGAPEQRDFHVNLRLSPRQFRSGQFVLRNRVYIRQGMPRPITSR